MELTTAQDVAAPTRSVADAHPVRVEGTAVRIDELTIDRQTVVDYLRSVHPSKQEIALVHALEIGVNELVARRERFKH